MIRMPKSLVLFAAAALAIAATALASQTASAQTPDFRKYQTDSKALISVVDTWTDEVEQALAILDVKPETAHSDAFLQLIVRGHGMAADMRGTAMNAPSALRAKHDAATDGIETIVDGLGVIADGGTPQAMAEGIKHVRKGLEAYSGSIRPVRYFASRAR